MTIYYLLFQKEREAKNLPGWPYKTCRDQKGIMLNESESVNACTMNFEGCEDGIKTNHGQSRIRVSLWTSMGDDPDPANLEPLQICYKLKTDRNIKRYRCLRVDRSLARILRAARTIMKRPCAI